MRNMKKTLIAAALISAGISSSAESNPPVYWPAMAMMPVQYGNQVVMLPVSGWITPRGFLPAFAPAPAHPAMAGAPPPQHFFPAMPPFPGMSYPGMTPAPNVVMQPSMPYAAPVPGQVQVPVPPQIVPGRAAGAVTGAFAPGMFMPGFAGVGAVPGMTPPALIPPRQAQDIPAPAMMPPPYAVPVPGMSGPMGAMPPPVSAVRPGPAMTGTALDATPPSVGAPAREVGAVPATTEAGTMSAPAVVSAAPTVAAGASSAAAAGATPVESKAVEAAPALRTEAAMVSVPAGPVLMTPTVALAGPHDRDGDGVANETDLCPDKSGVSGNLGCPADEGIALGGIVFRYDSDELTDESKTILDRLAQKLVRLKGVKLEVAGHTDARGDAMYNLDLSERRARAVRDYLVEQGVNPSRLVAKGYGQTRPLADNESREGRATNRRVELKPA